MGIVKNKITFTQVYSNQTKSSQMTLKPFITM